MIYRIVKMEFQPEKADEFAAWVKEITHKIKAFKGCENVKILRDVHNKNVFFTYSIWESEDDLNNYRNSKTFEEIWKKTKAMFSQKAQAWSTGLIKEEK